MLTIVITAVMTDRKFRENQVMPDKEYQNLAITSVFFTPLAR